MVGSGPSEYLVTILPDNLVLRAKHGQTLLDLLHDFRRAVPGDCGGQGTCGKCRVEILQGEVGLCDAEKRQLTPIEIEKGVRLACQQRVNRDLRISLPLRVDFDDSTKTRGLDFLRDYPLDTGISKRLVTIPLDAHEDVSSWIEELRLNPGEESLLKVARAVARAKAEGTTLGTAVYRDSELVGFEKGDTTGSQYAIAIDIGTTTVAAYLVSLLGEGVVAAGACANSQSRWGADVLSRISTVSSDAAKLPDMQKAIRDDINRIIHEVCHRAKVPLRHVYSLCVVGNPTMGCLFLGINPSTLGIAPYVPVVRREIPFDPAELHLILPETIRCVFAPSVSGYIGADIVAAALATEIDDSEDMTLLIDVGTNGETLLGNRASMVAGSNAAGPAFEGARISRGMRASRGAIERVYIEDTVRWHVIGDAPPQGICGSGLIDAVAALLDAGVVEPSGKIVRPEEAPPPLRDRIVPTSSGRGFVLARPEETATGQPLILTQRDIREVQLATGAIAAGRRILCRELGIEEEDIPRVLVAGAFGSHIDPRAAMRIGLLPRVPLERVVSVGNAAGHGACMMAMNRKALQRAKDIAERTRYVEFARQKDFQDLFAECMRFPES